MNWNDMLYVIAISFAVCGGAASFTAFILARRAHDKEATANSTRIIYLVSYIMMSLSIFFVSLRGLI